MPGCGSGAVVLPWSSPRSQHHAAVTRKIHLSRLFRFSQPPLIDAAVRLREALQNLELGKLEGFRVPAPDVTAMANLAERYAGKIEFASKDVEVSALLVLAIISVESSGRRYATSHAGAQGLMQLMPATAKRFGVKDSFDLDQNIAGGIGYLSFLMERFNGDPILVLAGYNSGENAIARHKGVPPYNETRDYIPKVLAAFHAAKHLCASPPKSFSAKCDFKS